jgi:hypothetical protein
MQIDHPAPSCFSDRKMPSHIRLQFPDHKTLAVRIICKAVCSLKLAILILRLNVIMTLSGTIA